MIRAAAYAALSSSLVKSDLVPIATGYVLVMAGLAVGVLLLRRHGAGRGQGAEPAGGPEPGAVGWLRQTGHLADTFAGGYLLLMVVIVAYYFGLVRYGGNFLESAFSGCAELLGIAAPVFLAATWLDGRRARRRKGKDSAAGDPD